MSSNQSNNNRQSNNNNNSNNSATDVRGPTSALSSFLREQGIRVDNRSRREAQERRRRQRLQENSDTPNTSDVTENASAAATTTITTSTTDDTTTEMTSILYTPVSTRRQRTRNIDAQSILNAVSKSKKQQKKKLLTKRKKRKNDSSDDDDSSGNDSSSGETQSDDDNYIGPDISIDDFKPGPSTRRSQAGRQLVLFCYQCKNRFTRPRTDKVDPSFQEKPTCPSCLSGKTPKPPAKKKKTIIATGGPEKINFNKQEAGPLSLQDICVNIVINYIEDIEAFGDISYINMDKIAKIVCRNRLLSNNTARLFMQPKLRELTLYDCTNVDVDGLKNVAHFCPNLQKLNLYYCGRITDEVLQLYTTHLPHLKSLTLSGAHLITQGAWIQYFKARGQQLETFSLRHSHRFQKDAFKELLIHSKNLQHLRLSRIVTLDNDWLDIYTEHGPTTLKTLEFSWPSEAPSRQHILTSEHMVKVLERTGAHLQELVLKGCPDMDDGLLVDGILPHCGSSLHTLILEQCDKLSSKAFKKLFVQWNRSPSTTHHRQIPYGQGFKHITIARCTDLEDDAFVALLCHSWKTLTYLNIHSLEKLSSDVLEVIAGGPVPDLTSFENEDEHDDDDDKNSESESDNTNPIESPDNNNNVNTTTTPDNNDHSDIENEEDQQQEEQPSSSPSKSHKKRAVIIDKEMLSSLSACQSLTYLDASFVRSMDDTVLTKLIQSCPLLERVLVWGCQQVSEYVQKPQKLSLEGREMSQVV
ncbi:unnamed protein product [Cunninghamella echinulata]